MNSDDTTLTIQWKIQKAKSKSLSAYFVKSILLFIIGIACSFMYVHYIELSQFMHDFIGEFIALPGSDRVNNYSLARGKLGSVSIVLFVLSIFYLYKSIKKQDTTSQSLEKNFNMFSLELHDDFFIYKKNTRPTRIDYKKVISVTLEDNQAWVNYRITDSIWNWTGKQNEDFFHFPLSNLYRSTFNIFQEKIKKYNPTASLITD